MSSLNSPNILNYFIGKGNVFFKGPGDADFVHMGNVPEFEFTPAVESLEHNSSMAGVKSLDRTVTLSKSAELRLVCEEITVRNLAIAVLGDVEVDTDGQEIINIFTQTAVSGQIRLVGTNDVGSRLQWDLNKVDFIPNSGVSAITDEWGQLELTGKCAATVDGFGTIKHLQNEGGAEGDSESET